MKRNSAGFTLIELIVVKAILAVLTGILAPVFISKVEKSRRARDMATAKQIEKVLMYALVEDKIQIPADNRTYGYGAWVMICNKSRDKAPEPYHNKNFQGMWCGADAGLVIGGNTSTNDWNYNNDLAEIMKEHGINPTSTWTSSNGNSEGWDWIIIEVGYNERKQLFSRIYSGYKNENGGINRTPTSNIEKLMGKDKN